MKDLQFSHHTFTLSTSPAPNPLCSSTRGKMTHLQNSFLETLWSQIISISNLTFNTETKLKYYIFVGFAKQQRKNEVLCYYNHVFGVWTEAAAKWGRLVWSHQLENIDWFVFLHFHFGTLIERVPRWHQKLSHELVQFLNAYFIEANSNEMLCPRSLVRNHHEQCLGSINQNTARHMCSRLINPNKDDCNFRPGVVIDTFSFFIPVL